jgi:hypothetical protein
VPSGRRFEIDPDGAGAWHGLAAAQLRLGELEESVSRAFSSVGLRHCAPRAHFTLGWRFCGCAGASARFRIV